MVEGLGACTKSFMALTKIHAKISMYKPQKFLLNAYILNEYVKEEEKKKTTDCPKILQKKSGEYLFSIST